MKEALMGLLWMPFRAIKSNTILCDWPSCMRMGRYPLALLYSGSTAWLCFFHRVLGRTMQRKEFKEICKKASGHIY